MAWVLNIVYGVLFLILSPWLLYKSLTTGKYRRGLWAKFFGLVQRANRGPCAWFHGVSVGEIHLLRPVIARFREVHPDWECIVSSTTDTGIEEARKHFAGLSVIWWPLDFSWAVRRALRSIRPRLVVLAEGEAWPNFLLTAKRYGIAVAIINGRMSPRSYHRFKRLRWLSRMIFGNVDLVVAQSEEYADHYRLLGARPERIHVAGSVKFDGVASNPDNPRTEALRALFAIRSTDLVWIAGSTQAPEEEVVLSIYQSLRRSHANLRLILVPRQKDRFDEVATLLGRSGLRFVRRSQLKVAIQDPAVVVLVDTIGELGAIWGLADIAFVGGSLDGKRGGQNMIEPAAYGAAVVFGPHVWNFHETAARLIQAKAAIQIKDKAEFAAVIPRLLSDADERRQLGKAARQFVLGQQGGTAKTIDLLSQLVESAPATARAA